ncbi:Transcription initiation protein spt3 [Rhodotorula toruloides]
MASLTQKSRYVYSPEINSMVYVFCGIKDADEDLVQFIEEVVKKEMVELASRRGGRAISVEDLIFLVRHDRAKVNRLRSYLSWRDVRKKMKEPEADDEIDGMEEPVSDKSLKVIKTTVRLPWEFSDAWADYLRGEDEPEDDEAEAYEVNKQRLREADVLTSKMSRDDYEQYSQARQASFVYRKSKKFRDFLALPAMLDVVFPSDEVLDVLGFLAYECVRALCDAGIANKKVMEAAAERVKEAERRNKIREGKKRGREEGEERTGKDEAMEDTAAGSSPGTEGMMTRRKSRSASPSKRGRKGFEAPTSTEKQQQPATSPRNKPLEPPTSLFSAPLPETSQPAPTATLTTTSSTTVRGEGGGADPGTTVVAEIPLFLQLHDVMQGSQSVQHTQEALKTSGMRNWRGGSTRVSNRLL